MRLLPCSLSGSVMYIARACLLCIIIMLFTCRVELEAEIRLQVDELMREELKNLKLVGG